MEEDARLRSTVVTIVMLDRSPDWDVLVDRSSGWHGRCRCSGSTSYRRSRPRRPAGSTTPTSTSATTCAGSSRRIRARSRRCWRWRASRDGGVRPCPADVDRHPRGGARGRRGALRGDDAPLAGRRHRRHADRYAGLRPPARARRPRPVPPVPDSPTPGRFDASAMPWSTTRRWSDAWPGPPPSAAPSLLDGCGPRARPRSVRGRRPRLPHGAPDQHHASPIMTGPPADP